MNDLSEEDVKLIHLELEKKFPLMLKGIQKEGLISSAVERPSRKLYGSKEQYDNVYTKAAALMESITRWHIFNDGNKRTGLLCSFLYLYLNQHYMVIPIDAVRFTQKIAATKGLDQEDIEELIEEIATWLHKYTSDDPGGFLLNVFKYNLIPSAKLLILNFLGFKKYVLRQLDYLFVTEAHPEYKQETKQVFSFLRGLMFEAMLKMSDAKRKHHLDLELPLLDVMRCAVSDHEVLITEENKLFESSPDSDGIRHFDSSCFHCRKKIHLETDPEDEEGYLMFEYEEQA